MSLAEQDTKSYSETVSFSSKVFPIGGLVTALSTLALCIVTNRWNQRDNGGMYWPYISDLAREPPESSLFAFGMTLTSVLLTVMPSIPHLTVPRLTIG